MQHLINEIISDIYAAKESILRGLIEQIEGRESVLSDAENLVLVQLPLSIGKDCQQVFYRDIQLGIIEVDMVEKCIVFIPV